MYAQYQFQYQYKVKVEKVEEKAKVKRRRLREEIPRWREGGVEKFLENNVTKENKSDMRR